MKIIKNLDKLVLIELLKEYKNDNKKINKKIVELYQLILEHKKTC